MLNTSAFLALCLVCFVFSFGPLQCKGTGIASEFNLSRSNQTRMCLWSCLQKETTKRHTCFKECLGRNKGGDLYWNNSIPAKIPHLAKLSRRRKRNTNDITNDPCPENPIGKNLIDPHARTPERHQYDTDKWYLNISWDPIQDIANFTGYALFFWCDDDKNSGYGSSDWIIRQKNETYVVFNDSDSCWNYNMTLRYFVVALPCRNGSFTLIDLPWIKDLTSISATDPTRKIKNNSTTTSDTVLKTPSAPTSDNKTIKVVSSVITITVLAAVIVTTYLVCRRKQRSRIPMEKYQNDAEYDAFIIFARNDQKWVDETLLPILEKECNYKCCVHYRDFVVGKTFVENMVDSVYTSRKVVAVMSKSFFTSKWCNFELQKAIYKHLDDSVVVIRIDDVSTEKFPKAIKKRSFIDYSNIIERPFFKTKLMKVLDKSE